MSGTNAETPDLIAPAELTMLGELVTPERERVHVDVTVDVAEILSQCATRENALDFLRGVAEIFAPKDGAA